jgi:hypothetical protein
MNVRNFLLIVSRFGCQKLSMPPRRVALRQMPCGNTKATPYAFCCEGFHTIGASQATAQPLLKKKARYDALTLWVDNHLDGNVRAMLCDVHAQYTLLLRFLIPPNFVTGSTSSFLQLQKRDYGELGCLN